MSLQQAGHNPQNNSYKWIFPPIPTQDVGSFHFSKKNPQCYLGLWKLLKQPEATAASHQNIQHDLIPFST